MKFALLGNIPSKIDSFRKTNQGSNAAGRACAQVCIEVFIDGETSGLGLIPPAAAGC